MVSKQGSRTASKQGSRPVSRPGSKPISRIGSRAGSAAQPATVQEPSKLSKNGTEIVSVKKSSTRNQKSLYRQDFPNHGSQYHGRTARKPKYKWSKPLPFTATSTAASDFVKWEGVKPSTPVIASHLKGGAAFDSTLENRDFTSENRSAFNAKPNVQRKPFKPVPRRMSAQGPRPFQSETTAGADFMNWVEQGAKPSTPFKPEQKSQTEAETRDFLSVARASYNGQRAPVVKSMAPKQKAYKPLPFTAKSLKSEDFKNWAAEGVRPSTPFKPKQNTDLVDEDRTFLSEARSQFNQKTYARQKGMKMKDRPIPQHKFTARSTAQMDFKSWRGVHASTPFVPNRSNIDWGPEDREFKSEARAMYNAKPIERGERVKNRQHVKWVKKPDDRNFMSEARGALIYPDGPVKRESFKPKQNTIEAHPFTGQTTHRVDFIGVRTAKQKSYKPTNKRVYIPDNRDFKSEARSCFQGRMCTPTASAKPRQASTFESITGMLDSERY
jgi:hypothetical protein